MSNVKGLPHPPLGSKNFIETIKEKLGILAKGRKILEKDGGFQPQEEMGTYIADFDSKKDDIGGQNAYLLEQ